MNIPGTYDMMSGLRRPEDPEMAAFFASPEGRALLEEAAAIDQAQRGGTAAEPPAPAVPSPATPAPAAPTAANPFAALLGNDGGVLQSLLGATQAPPRQTGGKIDPWDLLLHLGPALMQAGSRPGASFLGSVGEGLGTGMKAAQAARRDALTQEKEDRLYNLQRAKLGVDIAQTMKKTSKAPTVSEFFDEKTGQPYKAQYDEATGEWKRVGGVKVDPAKAPTVQEFYDPQGRPYKAQYDPATQKWVQVGGAKADGSGKLPEGFRYVDPADPAKGVELIPGYQQGKAALAAPQRLPEGYQPIDPADPSKGMRLIPGYLEGKRQVADVLSKPPEGFAWIDPANPVAGVKPLPGYAEGRAAQEAMKPFTLPENATRVAPAGPGAPSSYSRNTAGFENPTGNPAARNPNSTATGDGQFLDETWRELWPRIVQDAAPILMKKGIDPGRLTPQQILDLRKDPEISAVAIDTYASANRPVLRQALGRDPDPGELQTAHMFGGAGAVQILKAPPQTPVQQIVPPEVYAANERFLAGKTAGDVVNYFRQRQGRGQGVANAPSAPVQVASADQSQVPYGQQNQPRVGPGYQIVAQGAKVPKVDNAYDQTEGKNLAEERQLIADDAKVGRQTLPLVDTLDGLFQQIGTGKTVPLTTTLKGWAKSLGIDLPAMGITDNVGSAEAASALTREVSLKFIQQTKGAVSNAEMQIFAAMVPNIANTPEGNAILLNAMRAVAKRQIEIEKAARQYESQRGGRIDRGFADVKGEIFARHPLLPPDLAAQASKAPAAGPGPAPAPRGLPQPAPQPVAPPTAPASAAPAPRGTPKSIAPQIKMMDMDTLKQLVPEALSPEDRKAAADRWEELNRGAR